MTNGSPGSFCSSKPAGMDEDQLEAIVKRYNHRDDEFAQLVRKLCTEISDCWEREAKINASHSRLVDRLLDIHKTSKYWE